MIKGTELGNILSSETELALIHEEASNAYFAVEASYLEQEVGPVVSPYGNGCVSLGPEDREFRIVSGRMWGDDDDTVLCVEVGPGQDAAQIFRERLARDSCWDEAFDPEAIPEGGKGSVIVVSNVTLNELLASTIR